MPAAEPPDPDLLRMSLGDHIEDLRKRLVRAVLGAAIAIRADRLVTGDRAHFGPLYGKTVEGVLIVSPQLMVAEMKTSGWIPPSPQ